MNKIIKMFMWVLILVSIVILGIGFMKGYPASPALDNGTVDPLLYWAYAMLGIALVCIVVVGLVIAGINNPKSILKLVIGIAAVAVLCFVVYLVSAGEPALNLTTLDQPEAGTLKIIDTVLNLTYLTGAIAILAIVFGEILGAVRNR